MQDILTSLLPPESEPSLGVEILRGNVEGRWFSGGSTRSAAFSFSWLEYVGAVLTASFSPAAPIQLIENALKAGPGASAISNGMDLLSSAPTLSATALSLIRYLDDPRMDQEGKRRSLHAINLTYRR